MSIQIMDLLKIIGKYSLNDIIDIEQTKDLQFIALKKAYSRIKKKSSTNKTLFLVAVLQSALVGYQLSGKGEARWQEFGENIVEYINSGEGFENLHWWKIFLKNCKNNCRLIEMKKGRLIKFDSHKENFIDYNKLKRYYENMSELNKDLARIFSQKLDAKTITFAVKMFGYASRIVHKNIIFYPSNITIPIDSRLIKIYEKYTGKKAVDKKAIMKFYENLSKKYGIPPLHLDSLLWVVVWNF